MQLHQEQQHQQYITMYNNIKTKTNYQEQTTTKKPPTYFQTGNPPKGSHGGPLREGGPVKVNSHPRIS